MKLKYSSAPLLNYEWMDYNSLLEETEDGVFEFSNSSDGKLPSANRIILYHGIWLFEAYLGDKIDRRERMAPRDQGGWNHRFYHRIDEPLPLSGTHYNSWGNVLPAYTIP